MRDKNVSNYDKKMAVRGFVKQLQYDPAENLLHIFFGPSPVDQLSPEVIEEINEKTREIHSPALRGGDTRI